MHPAANTMSEIRTESAHTHWKIIRPWRPAVQSARRQTFGRHMKEMKAQTVESGPTKPHQSCLGNRHGKSSGRYMKRHVSKPNRNDPAKPFSKSIMWGRNESKPFAKWSGQAIQQSNHVGDTWKNESKPFAKWSGHAIQQSSHVGDK